MNNKKGKIVNRIINGLLVLGCLTVLFPLYMTVIIAFKQPSEMTNDVAGAFHLVGILIISERQWKLQISGIRLEIAF